LFSEKACTVRIFFAIFRFLENPRGKIKGKAIPVLKQLNTGPLSRVGEKMYSSAFS
jgi:hypothetical protein